jgi:hypothetical protein
MPAAWSADRRRSQAQADFWNPTGSWLKEPQRCSWWCGFVVLLVIVAIGFMAALV